MDLKTLTRIFFLVLMTCVQGHSQYWNGQDSLFGQEWINFDQDYFKFKVADDGVYRIDFQTLLNAGLPVEQVEAQHFQFWRLGKEIAVVATTERMMTPSDHFMLFGRKNRGEFDTHLFPKGLEDQLNPDYSMFSDSTTYFVTWNEEETGKRFNEVQNDLTNLPPDEPYFIDEIREVFDNNYFNYCQDLNCFIIFSHYDAGEGWAFHSGSHVTNFTLYPKFVVRNGPDATLVTRVTNNLTLTSSRGTLSHFINDTEINTRDWESRPEVMQDSLEVDINEVDLGMEMSVAGANEGQKLAVARYSFYYPREFRFEADSSFMLHIPGSADDKHIHLTNFNGGDVLRIWDFENSEYLDVAPEAAREYRFRLRGNDDQRQIFMHNLSGSVSRVNELQSVRFRNYSELDPDFIIITHPKFLNDGQGNNHVLDYAQYRSSNAGGNYTPVIVPITTLMDQFAYGIEKHPSAIRLFIQWALKNWSDPQHVFIMGKGVVNQDNRQTDIDWHTVPTFGAPGSDMLLTSNNLFQPQIPIGRIPVVEASEIGDYLEKIRTHEERFNDPQTIDDRAWSKQMIHLSGGDLRLPAEINNIRNSLDYMKDTIESSLYGPYVHTFQKKTSRTVEVSDNQRLTGLINDGVSLVTYFGHSGVQLIDFQIIDDVNTLPPNDRFHVFTAMGCYAGDIFHKERRSYSEAWALAERRGAIAFVANSSAGFIPTLKSLGGKLYHNFGNEYYGQPIGVGIKEALGEFIEENRFGNDLSFNINVELAFSLNICGDPAVRMVTGEGPDHTIDAESVEILEDIITIENDSLSVAFEITNLGLANRDSMDIWIEQTLPSGEMERVYSTTWMAPSFTDSMMVRIPSLGERAAGFNKLNIIVDPTNRIDERPAPAAEANNSLRSLGREYTFFVAADDARPVMPRDFSIVGQRQIVLSASTSDAHLDKKTYLLEIDTTEYFNSSSKRQIALTQSGGLIEWAPNLNWTDNTVYYWRVTPDSVGRGQYTWRTSSFVFIEDHPSGWNQSHYFQLAKSNLDSIVYQEPDRQWNFLPEVTTFTVRNPVVDDVNFLRPAILNEGGVLWEYYQTSPWQGTTSTTTREGVYVTVFDPQKLDPLLNPSPGEYGSLNTSGGEIPFFAFNTNRYDDRVSLMNFLENEVPEDHYVFFMTIREPQSDYGLDLWAADRDSVIGQSLIDVLESRGAEMLDELQLSADLPYIFIYQEGNDQFDIEEGIGSASGQFERKAHLDAFWSEGRGSAISTLIGPVDEWQSLLWQSDEVINGIDDISIDVIGVTTDGGEVMLHNDIRALDFDLSMTPVTDYPNLKLKLNLRDSVDLTSPQLDYWRVTYKDLTELAVDLENDFYFYADTMQQGEELELRFGVKNISAVNADSVLIHISIIDEKNNEEVSEQVIGPLGAAQRKMIKFERSTTDLNGRYRLIVRVNPDMAQKELTLSNNSFVLPFTVIGDNRNPLLDVTFDGVHILDGDLVSARPEINIRLTDENELLLLQDTSLFDVKIKYPNESSARVLSFQDAEVTFNPGTEQDNTANILINKKFPVDGIYQLSVNARDGSGNEAGDMDYTIRFEVVNEVSISELINYPNPFSTATRFVYTLTGDRSPEFFKIQIMTLSGKIVREITSMEMGPLKVGKHMSDFVYDGTDEFGERLANGVYLYRLIARDQEGNEIKYRDVGISEYYDNGWGKMVILR